MPQILRQAPWPRAHRRRRGSRQSAPSNGVEETDAEALQLDDGRAGHPDADHGRLYATRRQPVGRGERAGGERAGGERPAKSAAPTVDYKACMVSDTGGIDDNSFNENAWAGMERAQAELGVEVTFLESRSTEDYARNIDQHVADGCDMIVTVGFLLGDATAAAAEANPDIRFAIVDFAYDPAIPNVEGLVYATAEGAMLAGYASASWSKTGIVGTFGGINIGPGVTDFMDGFIAGVNYWNEQQGDEVRVLGGRVPSDPDSGTFTGNFDSTDDAKAVTQGMLDEGADVILPVGGPIGGGTFAAIEESGATPPGSASTSTGRRALRTPRRSCSPASSSASTTRSSRPSSAG